MPFAPSSVGDIIALVTLAAQIYQALDDAKGSSSQYRELAQQLKSFQTTLRVAESSLSRPDVVASEAALESINEEIRACRKLLDKFDEHVKAYRQALTRNRRSAVVAMRQIMWSLTKQKDIAELRQNLTQHSQTIVILMNVLILEATSAGSTDVKEIKVVSAEVLSLQKRIPAGITFDASSGNALSLIDAFGRKKTLTMEFFFSPEAFHETMLHHYSKTLAFDYIKKRHYVISTEDGKSIAKFEPNQWGAVVKKGAILVLSVEVKTPASQSRTCPTCHETDQGLMADDDWFECRRCTKRFIRQEEKINDATFHDQVRDSNMVNLRNFRIVPIEDAISPFDNFLSRVQVTLKNLSDHFVNYRYLENGIWKGSTLQPHQIDPQPTTFQRDKTYSFEFRASGMLEKTMRTFTKDQDWDLSVYFD